MADELMNRVQATGQLIDAMTAKVPQIAADAGATAAAAIEASIPLDQQTYQQQHDAAVAALQSPADATAALTASLAKAAAPAAPAATPPTPAPPAPRYGFDRHGGRVLLNVDEMRGR